MDDKKHLLDRGFLCQSLSCFRCSLPISNGVPLRLNDTTFGQKVPFTLNDAVVEDKCGSNCWQTIK